ncbi:MAG TPA: hypothetical protein ENK82_06020 [Campylobacterales bacterium]|nr:hypothetical protein [Campylobacterales bacterium]HHS92885.1 hypothetical protein [Campylobacterales bacterium]
MSANLDIDTILKNDEKKFLILLDQIVLHNIEAAKKELNEFDKFNKVLYETVEFTIQKHNEEEGILSKLFYRTFGIGKNSNKRREQLLMLGGNLKAHINQLKRDRKRVYYHYNNICSSDESLNILSQSFSEKVISLTDIKKRNLCNKYLKLIYTKIDEVDTFKKSLDMKDLYLESCISNYKRLLKRIPRNKEITEEKYIEYRA